MSNSDIGLLAVTLGLAASVLIWKGSGIYKDQNGDMGATFEELTFEVLEGLSRL